MNASATREHDLSLPQTGRSASAPGLPSRAVGARLAGWFSSAYHGAVPILAATWLAFALCWLLWPWLSWQQSYSDLTTGNVTWQNADKARDFRVLFLFVATAAAFSVGLGRLLRGICGEHGSAGAIGRTLNTLLLLALVPACWRLGMAVVYPAAELMPVLTAIPVAVAVLAILLLFRHRRELTPELAHDIVGASVLAVGAAVFGAVGVACAASRLGLQPRWVPGQRLLIAGLIGGVGLLLAVWGVSRQSVLKLRDRLLLTLTMLQLPLSLLLFSLVPPPLLHEGGRPVAGADFGRVATATALLVLACWLLLWRRLRRLQRHADVAPSLSSAGLAATSRLRNALSPLALAAPALFLALPALGLPTLPADLFHDGEQLLPWQQWVNHHKLPFVDFAPIHGLMPILRGLINSALLSGTAATFGESLWLMSGIAFILTFCAASALVGPVGALLLCLAIQPPDRLHCVAPVILLLANPALLKRPTAWLLAALALLLFAIAYNTVAGLALAAGGAPIAVFMAHKLLRGDSGKMWRLLAALGAGILLLLLLVPSAGQVCIGYLHFILDNGASHLTANGIEWRPSASAHVLLELRRFAWIGVALAAAMLFWREMARPREQRRAGVLAMTLLLPLVLLALAQWTVARIDPGPSRLGWATYIACGQLLPVLLLLLLFGSRPGVAAAAGLAILAAGLGALCPSHVGKLIDGQVGWRALPDDQWLFDGAGNGLPLVGQVVADPALRDLLEFRDALSPLLRPGETYLDLTNRQAVYYYLDLPVPALYSATYVAGNSAMQGRMLRQLRASPPPVVLISPAIRFDGGPASLRTYHLYRQFVLRYQAVRRGKYTFLVEPQRAAEAGVGDRPQQLRLLDAAFRPAGLLKLPCAWGNSWERLSRLFEPVADVGLTVGVSDSDGKQAEPTPLRHGVPLAHGAVPTSAAAVPATAPPPVLSADLTGLQLSGQDADFALLEFPYALPPTPMQIRWQADGADVAAPVEFTAEGRVLLVPLGAYPRWLLAQRLESLELRAGGRALPLDASLAPRVTLLKLRPPPLP